MNNSNGRFQVAIYEKNILICVEGMATKNNSHLFHDFVEKMLAQGFENFIIDFSLAKGMDSTFMGILIEISNFKTKEHKVVDLTLINVGPECKKILDNLGISKFLKIKKDKTSLPDFCLQIIEDEGCNLEKRLKLIQKAHENLINCDAQNADIFKDFLEMLRQELQILQQTGKKL